ncbi:MAG: DUF4190 domain-containing protein [Planctomycetes bacterium]|mgnify:CR=1 FL=1|nr:DUF4190 domain-containing protein [Planctomycetota bacterium]
MDYQIICPHCGRSIGIMAVQIGRPMTCPHCRQRFQVGQPSAAAGQFAHGSLFTFRCDLCQSRLEAYTGMVGRRGQCPTCGAQFTVPPPAERARRIGGTEAETEYSQPVHAFAAAGDKAPQIVTLPSGQKAIQCPRCKTANAVDRNNCRRCAAPFTLEGSEPQAPSGGLGTAALVLGILGIPLYRILIPSILAIVFGGLGVRTDDEGRPRGRGPAVAGLVLGILGVVIFVVSMLL